MRILILGGTGFIGRHLTELALKAGHEVTLFNRGRSGTGLFPEVELLVGDRENDLESLKGKQWDLAFDIASYYPRVTRLSCEVLAGSVDHYTLISTMALYADHSSLNNNETSPVVELEDPTVEEVTPQTYGGLKVLCEKVVNEFFADRCLLPRPGIIVGPYDTTDRMTYWVDRIAEGGQVLVPDVWEQPIQYIDAVDLMGWILEAAVAGKTGVYNLTGPKTTMPLGAFLEAINEALGSKAEFVKVDSDFLAEHLDKPGNDLPFFMPFLERRGFMHIDSSKAQAEGLSYRPLSDTILDLAKWTAGLPRDRKWEAGIRREKERSLLEEWTAVQS